MSSESPKSKRISTESSSSVESRSSVSAKSDHQQGRGGAQDGGQRVVQDAAVKGSLSAFPEQVVVSTKAVKPPSSTLTGRPQSVGRKGSDWEILGNLDEGISYSIVPKKHEGFLMKRRKWPLKGWHKRYFVLEKGLLTYGKSPADVARGRTHGRIDVGAAVISAKTDLLRIDIDDEQFIHHLKANTMESFGIWFEQLKQHRFYMQSVSHSVPPRVDITEANNMSFLPDGIKKGSSLNRGMGPGNVSAELTTLDDNLTTKLLSIQQSALKMAMLAQKAEDEQNSSYGISSSKSKKLFGLRKKRSGQKEQKPGADKTTGTIDPSSDAESSGTLSTMPSTISTSNPSLNSIPMEKPNSSTSLNQQQGQLTSRPISLPGEAKVNKVGPSSTGQNLATTPTSAGPPTILTDSSIRDEMLTLAQEIQVDVSNLMRSYTVDRDRLKSAIENTEYGIMMTKNSTLSSNNSMALVASLRQALNQAMQQNTLMRSRLQKIQLDSDISDLPAVSVATVDTLSRGLNQSLSYSSSCISEFFDAREYDHSTLGREYPQSDESSEEEYVSEDETSTTDEEEKFEEALSPSAVSGPLSFMSSESTAVPASGLVPVGSPGGIDSKLPQLTGRRQKLPVPKATTEGINLWNLLCKNIGKDLSKISMPVTLNEPLSALQRLCEELEYSDLLDRAAASTSSEERMTWVAAYVVSVYGSCQARAGHKPFNPLLGETFECIRDDRGFKYIAEQVSHHPPVSACHATSTSGKWTWSQDLHVKTKFWGKSMEFQPEGHISVTLHLAGGKDEVYTWNKITTCIHNLFGGADRWVDLYGQCVIKSPNLTCKIDFEKASYWSNKRHELYGTIMDKNGKVLQHLFGKWSEALYIGQGPSSKCIWRPAILPHESDLYYGFSRFAIELNEILDNEKDLLPPTDTRFRPDQRMLEEGHVSEAETMKLKLEQNQRERRAAMEARGEKHVANWFEKVTSSSGSSWDYNGHYWQKRQNPGFANCDFVQLW